jgi:hypothetical protein
MNPNNLPAIAQAAAGAALSDQPYMRATCALIASIRARAATALPTRASRYADSFANFLLFDVKTAEDAPLRMRPEPKGIFLRPQAGAGLPQCLRMTIGPPDHVDLAVAALEGWAEEGGHETLPRPRAHRCPGALHQHQPRTRPRADGPPGLSLHIARMGGYDEDEVPDETQMQGLGMRGSGGDAGAPVGGEARRGALWLHIRHAQPWTCLRPRPRRPIRRAAGR